MRTVEFDFGVGCISIGHCSRWYIIYFNVFEDLIKTFYTRFNHIHFSTCLISLTKHIKRENPKMYFVNFLFFFLQDQYIYCNYTKYIKLGLFHSNVEHCLPWTFIWEQCILCTPKFLHYFWILWNHFYSWQWVGGVNLVLVRWDVISWVNGLFYYNVRWWITLLCFCE